MYEVIWGENGHILQRYGQIEQFLYIILSIHINSYLGENKWDVSKEMQKLFFVIA